MQYRKLGRWGMRVSAVGLGSIVGATKTSHVEDNVAAADLQVDRGVFEAIDEILEPVALYRPATA